MWLRDYFQEAIALLKEGNNDRKAGLALSRQSVTLQTETREAELAELELLRQSVALQAETRDAAGQLVKLVGPSPPASMSLTLINNETGEIISMSAKAARGKMKLNLNPDGTVTGKLTLQDHNGYDTTLGPTQSFACPWASSDPGVSASPSPDNLSAAIAAVNPPPSSTAPQGVKITAGPATITDSDPNVSPITLDAVDNSSDLLNVKPGPAGKMVLAIA